MFLLLLAPDAADYVHKLWEKLLDPIGIAGVVGQLIFAGRMVVQWWVSEKRGKSVVPKVFWHMSLWGSFLTLIYGFGKTEPLVIMGQLPGVVVYARNLVLLSRQKAVESASVD